MTRLRRIKIDIRDTSGLRNVTDVRQTGSGDDALMDGRGAGDAKMLLIGYVPPAARPYNGVFRAYGQFDLDAEVAAQLTNGWDDMKVIRQAYVKLFTRVIQDPGGSYPKEMSYFDTGSDAKVRMHRLEVTPTFAHNGDGLVENITTTAPDAAHWSAADDADISSADWDSEHWDELVSPNEKGETRIRCTSYVGALAPATVAGSRPLYYYNPDAGTNLLQCLGLTNHGFVLKTPSEATTAGDLRAEFYAARSGVPQKYWPQLHIVYEPYNPTPDTPKLIAPNGHVNAHFAFRGSIPDNPDDPAASVEVMVKSATNGGGSTLWNPSAFPVSQVWPDGEFEIDNPRQPTIPSGATRSWRARQTSVAGIDSAWSAYRDFTVDQDTPAFTMTPLMGNVVTMVGQHIQANWQSDTPVKGYTIQLAKRLTSGDPLWRSPIWEYEATPPTPAELVAEAFDVIYDGPVLPAGNYSVRFRVWDSDGVTSEWVYDHNLAVTGVTDAIIETDLGSHLASPKVDVRITLYDLDQPTHAEDDVQALNPGAGEYSRGPGVVKAIIYDAANIGLSAYVSSPGELHFTLPHGHIYLSECIPWQRHYKVEVRDKYGTWRAVPVEKGGEGLLHDLSISTDDVIVYGMDYLGLLSLSIETARQPDADVDAPIDPDPDSKSPSGSKYIEKDIDWIINNQLERAIADADSPVGWIEVGEVEQMPEPTTIYSAFVQRLTFIKSLIDSYAQGSGVRSRVMVKRDKSDGYRHKFEVLEDSGVDRPEWRLEYGSLLQGFELVPFGDFAITVHGVGHRALNVKPLYAQRSAYGMDPQVWGNIAKAVLYNDLTDDSDLARRVLQDAAEHARLGKGVAIALRVRGMDVNDEWDLTDALPLAVDRGPVETRWWQPDDEDFSWWVIWGYQWTVDVNGYDELRLVVAPRIDNAKPLPDTVNHPLLRFAAAHTSEDWSLEDLPPEGTNMLLGVDAAPQYQVGLTPAEVKRAGGDFFITKLTQGTYFDNNVPGAHRWITQAIKQGLVPGAYHYLTRVLKKDGSGDGVAFNRGDKQCDYFVANLPNQSPEGLLIALDVENNKNADSFVGPDGKRYFPEEGGPKKVEISSFVTRWFQLFPNHPLFIYSNSGSWPQSFDVRSINELTFNWNASRQTKTTLGPSGLPENWAVLDPTDIDRDHARWGGLPKERISQYGYVRMAGYDGPIDANVFNGTKGELEAYAVSVATPPPTDRPRYRDGYNALMDALIAEAATIGAGTGNAYYVQGVADAREDAASTLANMRLSD